MLGLAAFLLGDLMGLGSLFKGLIGGGGTQVTTTTTPTQDVNVSVSPIVNVSTPPINLDIDETEITNIDTKPFAEGMAYLASGIQTGLQSLSSKASEITAKVGEATAQQASITQDIFSKGALVLVFLGLLWFMKRGKR